MPVKAGTRQALRERARDGDILAAVELIERCHCKSLKALIAQVCQFEVPVTPTLFDVCADAWAVVHQKESYAIPQP